MTRSSSESGPVSGRDPPPPGYTQGLIGNVVLIGKRDSPFYAGSTGGTVLQERTTVARSSRYFSWSHWPIAPCPLFPPRWVGAEQRLEWPSDDLMHKPKLVEHQRGQDERISVMQPHAAVQIVEHVGQRY